MIQQFILDHHLNSMRLAGRQVGAERSGDRVIAVHNPYTAEVIGTVPKATIQEVHDTFATAHAYVPQLSRFERAAILNRPLPKLGASRRFRNFDAFDLALNHAQ